MESSFLISLIFFCQVSSDDDYVSLTDMAKIKNPAFFADVIKYWMRFRATIGFAGLWEQINDTNFNRVEFDQFKNKSGHNYFVTMHRIAGTKETL